MLRVRAVVEHDVVRGGVGRRAGVVAARDRDEAEARAGREREDLLEDRFGGRRVSVVEQRSRQRDRGEGGRRNSRLENASPCTANIVAYAPAPLGGPLSRKPSSTPSPTLMDDAFCGADGRHDGAGALQHAAGNPSASSAAIAAAHGIFIAMCGALQSVVPPVTLLPLLLLPVLLRCEQKRSARTLCRLQRPPRAIYGPRRTSAAERRVRVLHPYARANGRRHGLGRSPAHALWTSRVVL